MHFYIVFRSKVHYLPWRSEIEHPWVVQHMIVIQLPLMIRSEKGNSKSLSCWSQKLDLLIVIQLSLSSHWSDLNRSVCATPRQPPSIWTSLHPMIDSGLSYNRIVSNCFQKIQNVKGIFPVTPLQIILSWFYLDFGFIYFSKTISAWITWVHLDMRGNYAYTVYVQYTH